MPETPRHSRAQNNDSESNCGTLSNTHTIVGNKRAEPMYQRSYSNASEVLLSQKTASIKFFGAKKSIKDNKSEKSSSSSEKNAKSYKTDKNV
jgi:hypothetical protein